VGQVQVRRVVIDTNVLVSALLFGGVPGELVKLWKAGRIQPVASRDIIDECLRVLTYPKFRLSEHEIEFLFSREILAWFEIVSVPAGGPKVPKDPSDDKFVWCADAGRAEAILSGDEHLLRCKSCSVPVLTVAEFLKKTKKTRA